MIDDKWYCSPHEKKNKLIGFWLGSSFFTVGKATITTDANTQVIHVANIMYKGSQIYAEYNQIVDHKVAPNTNMNTTNPVSISPAPGL